MEGDLIAVLTACALKDMAAAQGNHYVAAILDVKAMTEPNSKPHKRAAACQKDQVQKLMGAWLQARATRPNEMRDGDVAIVLDGGKLGNRAKLLKPFREFTGNSTKFSSKTVTVIYDEGSVKEKKTRIKGVSGVRQEEHMHLVSRVAFDCPERKRKHVAGSNRGSSLAFVKLPSWVSCWKLPFETKRKAYGKHRVDCGGKADSAGDDDTDDDGECDDFPPCFLDGALQRPMARAPKNLEPFCYHSLPLEFYEEVFTSYYINDVYDLSPGDGTAAKATLLARKTYVGICHADVHMAEMYTMLTEFVKENFAAQDSMFYQAGYASAKQDPVTDPKPKKRGKNERGGPKKKGKKDRVEAKESSDSDSDSEASGGST